MASELQIGTTGCLDRNDLHTLICETIAARLLDAWSDVLIARDADILDLLRHEVVDGNQSLGIKVDTLI